MGVSEEAGTRGDDYCQPWRGTAQLGPLNNKFVGPAAAQMLPGFSQTYLMVLEGFGSAGSVTSAEENVLGVGGSIE